MPSWNSLQIIIDDHLDILLNRLKDETLIDGFNIPKIKDYYPCILTFFAFFSIIYLSLDPLFKKIWKNKYYLKLNGFKRTDWNSRVVAFIHALIINAFCISLIAKYGFPWNKTENDYNDKEVDLYYKAISISLGYFMWDIIYSVYYVKQGGIGFAIHGVCAFLIYIFTFRYHVLGHYAILFLNYEISTIFLNIYWILDKLNKTGSILQLVNAFLLLVAFFTVRIAFGTVSIFRLLYDLFFRSKICPIYLSLYFTINIIIMQCLNYVWFYKMIKSVLKHFPGTSEPKSKPESKGKSPSKKTDRKSVV